MKRNYYLASGLKEYFEEVQVFTTSNYKILEEEASYPLDGLKVKYLNTFDYRTIISKLKKKKTSHFSEGHKKSWLVSFMIKLNDTFPFNIVFGEGGLLYILNGYKEGKKYLSVQKEKHIITSYRPAANVYIGYLLKKAFKDAIWVVNFHDFPIDTVRRNLLLQKLQIWAWRKLLKDATHNITVSHGVEKGIRDFSPRVSTLMNGVLIRTVKETRNNQKFKLVYTGSFYSNIRNPKLLFNSLKHLIQTKFILEDEIEIIYAGKDSKSWMDFIKESGLESISGDLGDISSTEAMNHQDTANINILLTWATKEQSGVITGKFFEYLGSTNRILTIINGIMDQEIDQIFQELNCGLVVATEDPDAEKKINEFLMENINLWKNKNSISYSKNLEKLSWKNQVEKLTKIMFR